MATTPEGMFDINTLLFETIVLTILSLLIVTYSNDRRNHPRNRFA